MGPWHPVAMGKALLMGLSIRRAWALPCQIGAQCSSVEWTKARVAVRNTEASTPQLDQANRMKAKREMLTSCAVALSVDET